jgi:hypothetical protein
VVDLRKEDGMDILDGIGLKPPEHDVVSEEYIITKALQFMEEGLGESTTQWLVDEDEDLVELVQGGLEMLGCGRGFSRDEPLTGMGIGAFYRMMSIIGFESKFQAIRDSPPGKFLDHLVMEHRVTGMAAHMYNLLERPSVS